MEFIIEIYNAYNENYEKEITEEKGLQNQERVRTFEEKENYKY